MAIVGLRNLHYAKLTKDDATGVTYGTPVAVPGVISADIKPGSNSATLYADDGPYETDTVLGDIGVTIDMADLGPTIAADLLGHTVTGGVMTKKSTDKSPYVAIMFESVKSNGKIRYKKLLKGKFQEPEENTKTKDDKVNFQTAKLEGKFVIRQNDSAWDRTADEDAEGYTAAVGTGWYTAVEPTAPTV
jgi:phage major tail protein, phi13 family